VGIGLNTPPFLKDDREEEGFRKCAIGNTSCAGGTTDISLRRLPASRRKGAERA